MINTFEAPIVLDINNDNQTGLKRKAFYQTLIDNRITKELCTTWLVRYYENNNGEYGEQITSEGILPYSRNLIANNDLIKIYNPLFPQTNYQVAAVKEANATHITIGGVVETTNVAGTGYKIDKLKYPNVAFNNINNTNISRYYNSTLAEFDAFDSMQVKIVMLADNTYKVPRIDQIQVLGVSA